MVAQKGTGQQSMNSGELAPDLAGRIDIKQYYSGGLRFLNIEPIAQAGFRSLPGTRRIGLVGSTSAPRFWRLKRSRTESFLVAVLPGELQIFKDLAKVATVPVPALTPAIAAEANLYLEADTIGIFHRDLKSKRVLRVTDANWTVDDWPYEKVPDVDYGGDYPKTNDVWEIYFRYGEDVSSLTISVAVDGEETGGLSYTLGGSGGSIFAIIVQDALRALPSLGPGVDVSYSDVPGDNNFALTITFSGDLAGAEYDVSGKVLNTSEASALPSHKTIGEIKGEAAISAARGWPSVISIVQDRLVYGALRAKPSGLLFSQIAEYFNINIKAKKDDGAKLEALRSQAAEEILHVKDSKYLLVFTDEAEYFATNRTISKEEPLNFVQTGQNKLARGTWPVEIENRVYYVGQGGAVLFSTAYDDIASAFTARMESLLAPHLVDDIVMTDLQRGSDDTDTPRFWMLRSDGRLVGSCIIRDQDITAFFEYAVNATIRSIGVDAANRLWIVVQRPGGLHYEVVDPATNLFGAMTKTSNAAGLVSGVPLPDGSTVWAETSDGFTIGPFTVAAGAIATGWAGTTMTVGEWLAPKWESMPRVLVTGDDKMVRRPGRIHTVSANVMGTTSIAIGANGQAARDVPLLRTSDPVDQPMPAKTELVTVAGIPGVKLDTTAVITQRRPGRLRVRDVTFEEKL